jgi:hypothetical protein
MERTMKNRILSLVAVTALAGPFAAQAADVTYDFTLNGGGQGPLANETSSGFFSFDDSIIPAGGGMVTGPALTGLSFTWGGLSFGLTPNSAGSLQFLDSSGTLDGLNLGTYCDPLGGWCVLNSDSHDWGITGFTFGAPITSAVFDYTLGDGQLYTGSATLSPQVAAVPEPSTLTLLLGGALAVLIGRRRKPRILRACW